MRKLFYSLLLLVCSHNVMAHITDSSATKHLRVCNFIFTTPVSKNTQINGLALGLAAGPWINADTLNVNGVNIELDPAGPLVALFVSIETFISAFQRDSMKDSHFTGNFTPFPDDTTSNTTINGISVSLGGHMAGASVRGFCVNGFVGFEQESQGLELTGIMNLHYNFKGVICAFLRNKTTHGKGVQFALFNTCKEGRLVQIGLLNRIGHRVTPFVNFSFKKKPQTTDQPL
ncbi:hypothetical protein ACTHGU_15925 [Chitinophagaceae bacterium MMS25-I14]